MTAETLVRFAEAVASFLAALTFSRTYLHMLQLESYQLDGYLRWLRRNPSRAFALPFALGIPFAAAQLILARAPLPYDGEIARAGAWLLFIAAAALAIRSVKRRGERKPFAMTGRMRRLFFANAALISAAVALGSLGPAAYLAVALIPPIAWVAGLALSPYERAVNRRFADEARSILAARPDLTVIGVTGSYGKTSVKSMLATILSVKYRVLASPESYNTPMGLTRTVRERLLPEHEVFVAEMGARHRGDIAELVELVRPGYAVLTSVGPQHLETFGSVEAVAETKFELVMGLPEGGAAFFSSDSEGLRPLYERAICEKALAGIEGEALGMRADEIEAGPDRVAFRLTSASGESARIEVRIPGRHTASNLALCAAVAERLGLTMGEIARGAAKCEPIPYRLTATETAGGMVMINDGYNSNPISAKAALDVLAGYTGRRKIVATPGFVELGGKEAAYNREFGRQIAERADVAILVGDRNARALREGLAEGGMADGRIYRAKNIKEVQALLRRIGTAGDVVLFENDLADNHG